MCDSTLMVRISICYCENLSSNSHHANSMHFEIHLQQCCKYTFTRGRGFVFGKGRKEEDMLAKEIGRGTRQYLKRRIKWSFKFYTNIKL